MATSAIHASSLSGVFVYDDNRWIVERADVLDGPVVDALRHDRRPVVTLTLMANHALGGLDPIGYHLVNVLIHLAATLVLFEVTRGSIELLRGSRWAPMIAFAASLLWAVHPLQTEAVTYTIQRAESMAGLCLLLLLLSLLRLRQGRPGWIWTTVAVGVSIAGMGCKATMIAAPVVALLYDGLVLSPSFRAALRERWGTHAAILGTCLVLVATGVVGGIVAPPDTIQAAAGFGVTTVTSAEYLASQPGVLLHYLRLAAWPAPLCIDWDWPIATGAATVALTAAIVMALLGLAVWGVVRRDPLAFPAIAFFVWLAPTSSIVPLRDLAVEHRMYLPLAALAVIVVGLVARLSRGRGARASAAVLAIVAVALAARTIDRNADYTSRVALWSSTLDVVPDTARARMNLGIAMFEVGLEEQAVAELATAVQLQPANARAQYNYGVALLRLGAYEEAVAPLGLAAGAFRTPAADRALAEALHNAGRPVEAIVPLRRAHAARPTVATGLTLAELLQEAGDLPGAIAMYEESVALAERGGDAGLLEEARRRLQQATTTRVEP